MSCFQQAVSKTCPYPPQGGLTWEIRKILSRTGISWLIEGNLKPENPL